MSPLNFGRIPRTRQLATGAQIRRALIVVKKLANCERGEVIGPARCRVCRTNLFSYHWPPTKSMPPGYSFSHRRSDCKFRLQYLSRSIAASLARRGAAVVRAGKKLDAATWREITFGQRGRCFDCGRRRLLTKGHLVPLAHRKATHRADNMIGQCQSCNSKQRMKIHVEAIRRGLVTARDVERWHGDSGKPLIYKPRHRSDGNGRA